MKLAFSWDDGALEDQRLFALHEKHEIHGMFFVPTRNREGRAVITPQIMRQAESSYVSFGGHTQNHTYLTDIPLDKVEQEIADNKLYLEDVLGHEVEHFCLPGGRYTDEILQKAYKHFKTVRTADTMNFTYNEGALKPAVHFYPRGFKSLMGNAVRNKSYKQMLYIAMHPGKDYFKTIENLIRREAENENSVVMIWGHSWELEEYRLWDQLEHFMGMEAVQQSKCIYSDMFLTRGK